MLTAGYGTVAASSSQSRGIWTDATVGLPGNVVQAAHVSAIEIAAVARRLFSKSFLIVGYLLICLISLGLGISAKSLCRFCGLLLGVELEPRERQIQTMAIVTTDRIIEATATLRGGTMAAVMVGHITAGDMVMAGRA